MPVPPTKGALSPGRRWLVELMQQLNFGRIENLFVCGGDPVREPPPRVEREIKFGGENGPRPEAGAADFLLKGQVIELFEHLDQLADGEIAVLEVKHGLPFRMIVAEVV
jgi:hypothetical protein